MKSTGFLITVDTEGDNVWARTPNVTTENARYLPRFQRLCDEFGFKPTYLVNYEMAMDTAFQKFGRLVLNERTAEVGLHVHAWNSPPICKPEDPLHHPYLFEYSDEAINDKMCFLTDLLTQVFDCKPVSHRAGRWGFDNRIAKSLVELGYLTDCSVTPGVSWRRHKGAPNGKGGPDYSDFPIAPYFITVDGQSKTNKLLEVPVTIRPNYVPVLEHLHKRIAHTIPGRALRRLAGASHTWLRPNGRNTAEMLTVVEWAENQRLPVIEFMIHSSELMPGGSPTFKTSEEIELLYESLEKLFRAVSDLGCAGMTLDEFRTTWNTNNVC